MESREFCKTPANRDNLTAEATSDRMCFPMREERVLLNIERPGWAGIYFALMVMDVIYFAARVFDNELGWWTALYVVMIALWSTLFFKELSRGKNDS